MVSGLDAPAIFTSVPWLPLKGPHDSLLPFIIILEGEIGCEHCVFEVRTFCLQGLVLELDLTLGFSGIESNLDRLDMIKI